MKKINLITLSFLLIIFNCSTVPNGSSTLLLLTLLEDSSTSKSQESELSKNDFWNNLDFAWKKAVAWQVKSIDYKNLPATLNSSQFADALNLKKLEYDCSNSAIGCYTQSNEKIADLKPVKYFKNLEILNLSTNQIQVIPSEIESLTKLQSLDLSYNKIEKLSTSINRLTNLEVLNFNANPLHDKEDFSENIFTHLNKLTNLGLVMVVYRANKFVIVSSTTKPAIVKRIKNQVIKTATIRFSAESTTGNRLK